MLVEPDAVIAQPIELFPGFEVLGIGAYCDVGLEMLLRQRVGQLASDLQVFELLTVGQEIEYKNFH
jgi:hypothetical protein